MGLEKEPVKRASAAELKAKADTALEQCKSYFQASAYPSQAKMVSNQSYLNFAACQTVPDPCCK